jgi:diguanylate cyclase (GGDEF)-like protein
MVVTPLRHRSAPIGVLKVYASRPAAFDDASAAALRLLVGIIAATMHRAREHELLSLRALHDPLTGLPNRHQFESVLAAKVMAGRPFGLVYLDLNGFKRINDERGHAAGDAVLQSVARRLTAVLREHDLVARIGGDEFVVLLDGVHSRATATEATLRLQHRLEECIADEESTPASAGIALYPDDGGDAQTLLARADACMYADKQARATPS